MTKPVTSSNTAATMPPCARPGAPSNAAVQHDVGDDLVLLEPDLEVHARRVRPARDRPVLEPGARRRPDERRPSAAASRAACISASRSRRSPWRIDGRVPLARRRRGRAAPTRPRRGRRRRGSGHAGPPRPRGERRSLGSMGAHTTGRPAAHSSRSVVRGVGPAGQVGRDRGDGRRRGPVPPAPARGARSTAAPDRR